MAITKAKVQEYTILNLPEQLKDFLQEWGNAYVQPKIFSIFSAYEAGEACYFVMTENEKILVLPLIKRSIPTVNSDFLYDLVSAYGYPGAVANFDDEKDLARFLQQFNEYCQANKVVSSFLRLGIENQNSFNAPLAHSELVRHGQVVVLDLTLPAEVLLQQMDKSHRYEIRQTQKNGFTTVLNEASLYPEFVRLYQETMAKLQASSYYYFSTVYFQKIREQMGQSFLFIAILSPEQEAAAVGLFLIHKQHAFYHLSGSAAKYRKEAPTKKLIYEAILALKARGVKTLNLGGGLGGQQDALFHFKQRFGGTLFGFKTLRWVHLPHYYLQLCKARHPNQHLSIDLQGYFPQYRQSPYTS